MCWTKWSPPPHHLFWCWGECICPPTATYINLSDWLSNNIERMFQMKFLGVLLFLLLLLGILKIHKNKREMHSILWWWCCCCWCQRRRERQGHSCCCSDIFSIYCHTLSNSCELLTQLTNSQEHHNNIRSRNGVLVSPFVGIPATSRTLFVEIYKKKNILTFHRKWK